MQLTHRGFSLVELLTTLTVLAIVLAASVPALGNWIANSRVRSTAESIQNGLRLAQSESVRRNRQAVFSLTNANPGLAAAPAANGSNWYVRMLPLGVDGTADNADNFVQSSSFTRQNVQITGPAQLCFNSAGRQPPANTTAYTGAGSGFTANCTPAAATYIVTVLPAADHRTLQIQVSAAGRIRMCDPAKASDQPDAC